MLDSQDVDMGLVVERGAQMKRVVAYDVAMGLSMDAAITQLAEFLGISSESVKLAIALANDAGR